MVNNIKTQNPGNVFQHQSHPSNLKRPRGGVRQDKCSSDRALSASSPVSLSPKDLSALALNRKLSRSQIPNIVYQKKQKVTMRINPINFDRLVRKAKDAGIPHSVAAGIIFDLAMQGNLEMEHASLIREGLKSGIRHETASMRWLIVRQAYDIGQIRSLLSSLLGLILKDDEAYNRLMDKSEIVARQSITNITPQIRQMKEILDTWLANIEKESNNGV